MKIIINLTKTEMNGKYECSKKGVNAKKMWNYKYDLYSCLPVLVS